MIEAEFSKYRIRVEGHSTNDENDINGKLVCAAVSSAVIMTANAITEILKIDSVVVFRDGYLDIKMKSPEKAEHIIKALELHLNELSKEHKNKIKIIHADYKPI